MNDLDELVEAFRLIAKAIGITLEKARELADLASIPEIPETPKEKRNPLEGLRSAQPVRCPQNHRERWHTAATGE